MKGGPAFWYAPLFAGVFIILSVVAPTESQGQSDRMPSLAGIAYGPSGMHTKEALDSESPMFRVDEDMRSLAAFTHRIRTYGVSGAGGQIPAAAHRHGIKVSLGLWLNRDRTANNKEIENGLRIIRSNPGAIDRVLVGNEVLLRQDVTPQEMVAYIGRVKRAVAGMGIEVSTADTFDQWMDSPELARTCDFIAVHLLPYWDGVAVENAVQHVSDRYDELQHRFPGKRIVIAETGWPSRGKSYKASQASPEGQSYFLRKFLALADARHFDYYILEAFDQPWKTQEEGQVGTSWGIMDADRRLKIRILDPLRVADDGGGERLGRQRLMQ